MDAITEELLGDSDELKELEEMHEFMNQYDDDPCDDEIDREFYLFIEEVTKQDSPTNAKRHLSAFIKIPKFSNKSTKTSNNHYGFIIFVIII